VLGDTRPGGDPPGGLQFHRVALAIAERDRMADISLGPGHRQTGGGVEAAAQQDQFEGMYRMMFETQAEWGEGQTSEAERFRGYAETLGLDMTAYDQAVADPATRERVEEDFNAGRALKVSGTPTFFLDGKQLDLTSPEDLPNALDAALNQ